MGTIHRTGGTPGGLGVDSGSEAFSPMNAEGDPAREHLELPPTAGPGTPGSESEPVPDPEGESDAAKLSGATRRRRPRRLLAAAGLAALLAGCGATPGDPETQVRAVLTRAEQAAEAKDLEAIRDLIDDTYADEQGNDRAAVRRLIALHFLRNDAIHLLTRVRSLEFPKPARAEVTLLVAMAGRPIPTVRDLAAIRADLYRFDLEFQDAGSGEWRVIRARWRRARTAEFL